MTSKAPPAPRLHDLDTLRATAMLLGIVVHAALFLLPDHPQNPWPVRDAWADAVPVETNPYLHVVFVLHGFRMPVFFLLSGFFTAMLWRRRGLGALVRHRLKRIGLPLALGAVTVVPVCAWLFRALDPVRYGGFDLVLWPFAWVGSLYHLWFLWHLLLLAGAFALAVRLGVRFVSRAWWGLLPLSGAALFFMEEQVVGADTADTILPAPAVLGFYAAFFAFGAFWRERGLPIQFRWALGLLPALLVAYPGSLWFLLAEPGSAGWAAGAACEAAFAWLTCFGLLGAFRAAGSGERRRVRYLSDASYWLYLAHLPLVLAAQGLLVDAGMDPALKLALILVTVTPLLLAVYHLGVRFTWLGTLLNGPRLRPPPAPRPPKRPLPERRPPERRQFSRWGPPDRHLPERRSPDRHRAE